MERLTPPGTPTPSRLSGNDQETTSSESEVSEIEVVSHVSNGASSDNSTVPDMRVSDRACESAPSTSPDLLGMLVGDRAARIVRRVTPDFVSNFVSSHMSSWIAIPQNIQRSPQEPVTTEPQTEAETEIQVAVSEQLVPEQPVPEQPVPEQPVPEQPVSEQPVSEQPVPEPPVPIPLTCCERFKQSFVNAYILLTLICKTVMSCLYRWLCCCFIKKDDERLSNFQSQLASIANVAPTVEPESGESEAPIIDVNSVSGDEDVTGVQQRYNRIRHIVWGSKQRPVGIAANREAWEALKETTGIKDTVVDYYAEAFKFYPDNRGTVGIWYYASHVTKNIEDAADSLYAYIENERINEEEERFNRGEAIGDDIARSIRHRLFADILFEGMQKLNMTNDKIKETYQLFNETDKEKERLEDKEDDPYGGSKLYIKIPVVGLIDRDMPYGTDAYKMAIQILMDKKGIII